jgi:hypothetical protein
MTDIQAFIQKKKSLFWAVPKEKKNEISDSLLVETILNYGSLEDVRELFSLLGMPRTAAIFFQTSQNIERHNYFPPVENYFRLYFNRHVS